MPSTVGWGKRLKSGLWHKLLDRLDDRLETGAIDARLPDGTQRLLGGKNPGYLAEVELKSWTALVRLARSGSVGWYQAWERGEWSSPDPVPLFALFMANGRSLGDLARAKGFWRIVAKLFHWKQRNSRAGSARNIAAHYDLGNDFYASWLDETMTYSSAIFTRKDGRLEPLIQAQQQKMAAISKRLQPKLEQSLLEIGCGWGALSWTMARQFDCDVTAISLSDEQLQWARAKLAESPGLKIAYLRRDYRDVIGQFDMITSVEMVEAVGQHYWPDFMDCIARCLKPGGRAAIQYISIRDDLFDAYAKSADFIQTYIFPGGMLIRESAFIRLAQDRGLSWEDHVSFGEDYADTLKIWRARFDEAVEKGKLPQGFDARFVALWRYYLMYCEGGFRGGGINVHQVTLVKTER